MGIRFYCPNGHKLNVKEFQAGRRGICPYCGAKIQIPTHSTRGSTHEPAGRADAGIEQTLVTQPVQDMAATVPSFAAPSTMATWPAAAPTMATPAAAVPTTFSTPQAAPSFAPAEPFAAQAPAAAGGFAAAPQSLAGGGAMAGGFASAPAGLDTFAAAAPTMAPQTIAPEPPAPAAPAAAAAAPDPLVEAGDAVWYVRPTSGGQFGPANASVMRQWLSEGRILADALVWREGWRDWQQAGDVFPQIRGDANPLATIGISPAPRVGGASAISHRPAARQSRNMQLAIIVVLVLAVLVLLGVFIYVWNSTGAKTSRRERFGRATIAAADRAGVSPRVDDRPTF